MMKSMKRTNIFIKFAALATTVTMVACTEEECVTETLTITGTIESPITKTALDGPDAGGVYKTVWKDDDTIAIFSGESQTSNFTEHKLLSGAGTNTGQFNATGISSNDMIAIYPASIAMSRNGVLATIDLPKVQKYVEGNIPENAYPMYGSHNNGTLKFANVCSVLKIPMYGDVTVKSITFSPNSDRIKVSGKAVIDWSERVMTMYSPSYSYIKLDCGEGVKLTGTETDFHMVVPPFRYVDGFTLTITTDKGNVVKALKSTITLDRSVLYPIEAFECKVDDGKGDNIVFEDANFKAYIVANFDKDNDGEISYEEALDVTRITIITNNISSLVGIEYMINLQYLRCIGNGKGDNIAGALKSIDVSKNTELYYLRVSSNPLSSLDVSNNTKLQQLYCDNNNLDSLDISHNPELETLYCNRNNLSSLDAKNNPELVRLDCYDNNLSSLNVCNNQKLQQLYCDNNNLSSLDVSHNPKLQSLNCDGNNLSSIDVKYNPELYSLSCNSNNLSSLDISKNTSLKWLYATSNPLTTLYIYSGQQNGINTMEIPSTTKLVVKGSEEHEEPEEWANKVFWHKSLGMRFTATWCGYCPNLATSFAKATSQYPNKIEMLNLHPTSSNLGFSGTTMMENIFRITGYPTGIIDYRSLIENYTSNDYTAKLIVNAAKETESKYPTKTGISFTSSVSDSKLDLKIKLYIKEKGDYKVTAVLLEDNIIGYQNGGVAGYNHSSIARVAFTDITGEAFSTTADNKTAEKSYSVTIPNSYNKDNLRILVYVLKQYGSQPIIRTANYGDYYVDNATSAPLGMTKDLIFIDGSAYGGNEDTKDGGEITLK